MSSSKKSSLAAIAGLLTLFVVGTALAGKPTFQGSPPASGSGGGGGYGHGGNGGGNGGNYGRGYYNGYHNGHNHNNWSVSIGTYPYWGGGYGYWGGGYGPYWGAYAPYYYGYPYYYSAPVISQPIVIEQAQPQVYIEQQPQYAQQAQPPQPVATNYWYFCEPAQGYWPYVKECPTGWQRVSPQPPH